MFHRYPGSGEPLLLLLKDGLDLFEVRLHVFHVFIHVGTPNPKKCHTERPFVPKPAGK